MEFLVLKVLQRHFMKTKNNWKTTCVCFYLQGGADNLTPTETRWTSFFVPQFQCLCYWSLQSNLQIIPIRDDLRLRASTLRYINPVSPVKHSFHQENIWLIACSSSHDLMGSSINQTSCCVFSLLVETHFFSGGWASTDARMYFSYISPVVSVNGFL